MVTAEERMAGILRQARRVGCVARSFQDGTRRCVPWTTSLLFDDFRTFADPACAEPELVEQFVGEDCPSKPAHAVRLSSSLCGPEVAEVLTIGAEVTPASTYSLFDGYCLESSTGGWVYHEVGAPVAPPFPVLTAVVE